MIASISSCFHFFSLSGTGALGCFLFFLFLILIMFALEGVHSLILQFFPFGVILAAGLFLSPSFFFFLCNYTFVFFHFFSFLF
ncbi:hypothetical protein HOY80DRAFT_983998 [Tuber brumale]|nr:hypothetical protein HOY80DRAFT_983998 [Tuber brumale]